MGMWDGGEEDGFYYEFCCGFRTAAPQRLKVRSMVGTTSYFPLLCDYYGY